jgi:hypothetical protein
MSAVPPKAEVKSEYFTRGTPRGLFGSMGLMAAHSWSVSL